MGFSRGERGERFWTGLLGYLSIRYTVLDESGMFVLDFERLIMCRNPGVSGASD